MTPPPRGTPPRRARGAAPRHYDIPDSKRTAVSVDTLLDWAGRYRNGGFEALSPKPRQDRGQFRAVTPQLASLIERLKRENPHRTGMTLLRELALSSGPNAPALSASTLYRFLKQRGLSARQLLAPQPHKKFEAELSNQIWQADMLFGPWVRRLSGGRMQAFLHATLDDASRLIPHAQFYASQGLYASLDCLRHAVAARGVPLRLYIDNAKIYRSPQLARISQAIVRLNQSKKQHPILICDEAQLLCHSALEQLPLLLNFDMDSSRYLTLLLVGPPLLRRTLSLQMHEPLRQRIAVPYHLEGLSREELDAYLAHQLKAAGVSQPLFDDTARQALYQATKGILRKVNKLALTALRLAASRKESTVGESILLDATAEALL